MINNILDANIGFGTYKILDQTTMENALKRVISLHYGFIDTAVLYQNEHLIGNVLTKFAKENSYFQMPLVQSKVWPSDFHQGIKKMLLGSLKRLQLDHIESYLLHRPHIDNSVNVKAWKELIACQKEGLVNHIGVSNFEPDMIRILYNETSKYPELVQNEASLTYIKKDRIVFCNEHHIKMQGWRTLGDQKVLFKDPLVISMAKKYQCSIAQLLIAYSKAFGFIPIIKTIYLQEISENIDGLKIHLDQNDVVALENKCNTHKSTTHNECDSYANLALDEDWYLTH